MQSQGWRLGERGSRGLRDSGMCRRAAPRLGARRRNWRRLHAAARTRIEVRFLEGRPVSRSGELRGVPSRAPRASGRAGALGGRTRGRGPSHGRVGSDARSPVARPCRGGRYGGSRDARCSPGRALRDGPVSSGAGGFSRAPPTAGEFAVRIVSVSDYHLTGPASGAARHHRALAHRWPRHAALRSPSPSLVPPRPLVDASNAESMKQNVDIGALFVIEGITATRIAARMRVVNRAPRMCEG